MSTQCTCREIFVIYICEALLITRWKFIPENILMHPDNWCVFFAVIAIVCSLCYFTAAFSAKISVNVPIWRYTVLARFICISLVYIPIRTFCMLIVFSCMYRFSSVSWARVSYWDYTSIVLYSALDDLACFGRMLILIATCINNHVLYAIPAIIIRILYTRKHTLNLIVGNLSWLCIYCLLL